ncbi:hypothetical protein CYLTODRAFT_426550 [Cylindrobasidium torrendii FP15055 ss-10]|uniref:DUF4112 domain-containing protein n=1 Tax=Cylindrobasidium torrendii FP15055 ss-10 TaxID=1314674 RepID=A0A0D7B073_9AGAR|nr:hypothetical protein CYLTODRAFT_426550 [Cylindrobasidium torrendii FP15055 ss-10]
MAGQKLFEKHMESYSPADPYYETYKDSKGVERRRKRTLPPGLSKRDAKILKSVSRRAHYLDKGFSLCGLQFGWTFLIGIVPGLGDIADATLNYTLVVRKARKADIPGWLLRRMLFNNAVSAGVGLVPIAGDVVLAMWKANSRNAALLEEFLRIRGEEYLKLQAQGQDPEAVARAAKDGDSKGSKRMVAKGVAAGDVAQVKPGSGKTPGETIEAGTSAQGEQEQAPPPKSRSRLSSWIRPQPKGKFVENVDSSESAVAVRK